MTVNFDRLINRRDTHSTKWKQHPDDVLPLWVADMDFASPEVVLRALRAHIDHGVLGYEIVPPELLRVTCERMARLFNWQVEPEQLVVLNGVISGFNIAARALCKAGDGVLVMPPVYPPILDVAKWHHLELQFAPLVLQANARTLHYDVDFDAFESAITPRTRLVIISHPHNPIGQSFTRAQLARLANIVEKHNLYICSDEIHHEILLGNARHTPLAVAAPEISARIISFIAPTKTFNLPGIACGFAIIPDPARREHYRLAAEGLISIPKGLSMTATRVAYSTETDEWLSALRAYLTENRDALVDYAANNFPNVRTTVPDATYLAWLDFRDTSVADSPAEFFLQRARVALNDGATFGPGGKGFVRFNFGCPRSLMMQALEQMKKAFVEG